MGALIPHCATGWTPGVFWQMEEARIGEWGRMLHGHGGWRIADLRPILKAMVWHHGWCGWVGIEVGPTEVFRKGVYMVSLF